MCRENIPTQIFQLTQIFPLTRIFPLTQNVSETEIEKYEQQEEKMMMMKTAKIIRDGKSSEYHDTGNW